MFYGTVLWNSVLTERCICILKPSSHEVFLTIKSKRGTMNWQKLLWKLNIDQLMDFSLKSSLKNLFNFRYYSNTMHVCFLRNLLFQMLMQNDNVAMQAINENYFFVQTIKHWKGFFLWPQEKLARMINVWQVVDRREEGEFFLIHKS